MKYSGETVFRVLQRLKQNNHLNLHPWSSKISIRIFRDKKAKKLDGILTLQVHKALLIFSFIQLITDFHKRLHFERSKWMAVHFYSRWYCSWQVSMDYWQVQFINIYFPIQNMCILKDFKKISIFMSSLHTKDEQVER